MEADKLAEKMKNILGNSNFGFTKWCVALIAAGWMGAVANAQTTILSEDFTSLTTGADTSTSSASSTALTSSTTPPLPSNFSAASAAYSAGGKVKLGGSSAIGSLTTKTLDLSQGGGSFTVEFDVKGWTTVEGSVTVTPTGIAGQTATYTAVIASASYEHKTLSFTGGQANSTIVIATTAKRAFLDNIVIKTVSGGGSSPTITLNPTSLSGLTTTTGANSSVTNYTVTGTNLGSNNVAVTPNSSLIEISTNASSGFATNALTLTQTGGVVSNTVYVRIGTNSTATNISSTISHVSGSASTNLTVSGTISQAGQPPVVTSTNFLGQVNVPFSQTIPASGSPTNFTLVSGTLPGGLTFNSNNGTITGTPTSAVTNNITVTAENSFGTSSNAIIGLAIAKGDQTITFTNNLAGLAVGSTNALTATASSGLAVSYASSSNSVATISGSSVVVVGTGSATITASQAGNDNWNPATAPQPLTAYPSGVIYWNFNTNTTTVAPTGWTIGAVSQGNNNGTTTMLTIVSPSSGYTNSYGIPASGGTNAGAAARIGAIDTGTNGSAYFEFTVTAPNNSTNLAITNLSFGSRSTSTGPQSYGIRSSEDNYVANLAGGALLTNSTWALASNSLSVRMTNGVSKTFRVYGYNGSGNATAGTANWRIDDLTLGVGELSLAPNITSTNAFSGTVGVAFSNTITATGSAPIAFSGTNLPGGLSVATESTNGVISGTPTAAGIFTNAVLTATNAAGTNNQAATFTIAKGTPTISVPPTARDITLGQTLAFSGLTGGSASVGGTFSFTDSSVTPPAGTYSARVTFSPTDTTNYNTATTTVSLTVNPTPAGTTYDDWLQAQGATPSDANAAMFEYVFGAKTLGALDPSLKPTVAIVPPAGGAGGDTATLVLTYYVRQNTVGLTVTPKTSADLAAGPSGWVMTDVIVANVGDPREVNGVSVQQKTASVPVSGTKKFLRVEAVQQ